MVCQVEVGPAVEVQAHDGTVLAAAVEGAVKAQVYGVDFRTELLRIADLVVRCKTA